MDLKVIPHHEEQAVSLPAVGENGHPKLICQLLHSPGPSELPVLVHVLIRVQHIPRR